MKLFTSLLFLFLSLQGFNQIIIRGAKNTEIIETNKNKDEVKEIKDINFTKLEEEKIQPTYVIKNNVSKAVVETKEEKVIINIYGNETIETNSKNVVIIDLDKAKQQIDSTKNFKEKTESLAITQPVSTATPKVEVEKTPIVSANKTSSVTGTVTTEKGKPEEVLENNISKANKEYEIYKEQKNVENLKTTTTAPKEQNITAPNTSIVSENKEVNSNQNKESGIFIGQKPVSTDSKPNTIETSAPKQTVNTTEAKDLNNSTIEAIKIENTKQNEDSGIFIENNKQKSTETNNIPVKTIEKTIIEPVVETAPIVTETKKPLGNLNTLENIKIEEPSIKTNVSETKKPVENLNTVANVTATTPKAETLETNEKEANPKNGSWSASIKFGVPAIIGDVNSKAGYGASVSVQKAIGHVFSLRFEALALETYGLSPNKINNVYPNYKTRFSDYTLQGVFTLNNLNFYKKEPKVLYHLAVGGGLATRYTWTDSRNENGNLYNYDNLNTANRKEILKSLNSLLDKKYETSIPKDADKMSIKNTNILPTLVLGLGIDIKLSEKFDLNLSTRFSNHFDDNLDGLKNGKNSDWMSFTALGITYKFGSKNKSLLWTNPIYSKTEELEELKKKVEDGNLLKDEDKDGIADIFDQDLNTPEKVAVDSRGIPSDMDKDGVPDYKDAQPFTPIGAKVDEKGIAIDTDKDGVADILDLENNTASGNQVDASGRTINGGTSSTGSGSASAIKNNLDNIANLSDFDLIFFDENSIIVKKEFYSILYKISRYINANPNTEILITGYTDVLSTEKYNLNLSEKRVNTVYKTLVQMFKVAPNNLRTNFEGEKNPIIEGLPEQKDANMEAAYYINRRVEFKILK